jgi:hypothetical protein
LAAYEHIDIQFDLLAAPGAQPVKAHALTGTTGYGKLEHFHKKCPSMPILDKKFLGP